MNVLAEKRIEHDIIWGFHTAPWDLAQTEYISGKSRYEAAQALRMPFEICPRTKVEDGG